MIKNGIDARGENAVPQIVTDIGDGEGFAPAIATYIKRKYNIAIAVRTAAQICEAMGSAMPLDEDVVMDVRGRDQVAGLPRTITINAHEITEALTEPLVAIITSVRQSLEAMPVEQFDRIITEGVIITGRATTLRTIDVLLTEAIGVPIVVAVSP